MERVGVVVRCDESIAITATYFRILREVDVNGGVFPVTELVARSQAHRRRRRRDGILRQVQRQAPLARSVVEHDEQISSRVEQTHLVVA